MEFNPCVVAAEKLVGKPLSDADKTAIDEAFNEILDKYRGADIGDIDGAVMADIARLGEDMRRAAIQQKRAALLNAKAEAKAVDYIRAQWGDSRHMGLRAFLGGVTTARMGSRRSVALQQQQLTNHYLNTLFSKLEKEGVHSLFVSGKLDRETWKAMHELARPEPDPKVLAELPEDAVKLGTILNEYNELARIEANQAGADIRPLTGRVIKQTHDPYRIRAAGEKEWRAFVEENLDLESTLGALKRKRDKARQQREALDPKRDVDAEAPKDPDTDDLDIFLNQMFTRFAAGEHYKVQMDGQSTGSGFANVAARLSQERVLHFKSPDASFDYNARFGSGNLAEGMVMGLEFAAQSTALMRSLGPNPEQTLDRIINTLGRDLQAAGDVEKLQTFGNEERHLKRTLWPNITGEARIPHSQLFAQASGTLRAVEQMAHLGFVTISSFGDVATYGSEVRYQGGSMLAGVAESIGAALKVGKTSAEKKELLGMLGVYHGAMRGAATARYDVSDQIPGRVAKTVQLYFKFAGLRWWTDRQRTAFALSSSHQLALKAKNTWDQLDPGLSRVLGMYNIDAGKWDLLRQGTQATADGTAYMTPEGLDDLDDKLFSAYLTARGAVKNKKQKATATQIRDLRTEMKDSFRSYFADRATVAIPEANARTRATLLQGTQPGAPVSEGLRHIAVFKSFPVTVLQQVISREIYGRGAGPDATLREALMNGNGELAGLANVIVASTLAGYASMTVGDLLKGLEPRNPDDPRTWLAAMLKGGALGIYGDFLFGEMKSRFGDNFLTTALGPTAGLIGDVADIAGRLRDGELSSAGDAAIKLGLRMNPLDLFYTKAALDYLIVHQIAETTNPGYARRLEQRQKKEHEREYWLKPTDAPGVR